MLIHWLLLIFSMATLASSISLIKHHRSLDRSMDDYTEPTDVEFGDYVLTGVLGYLGLPASIFGICACLLLIFIVDT